jgi:hypothetical protein
MYIATSLPVIATVVGDNPLAASAWDPGVPNNRKVVITVVRY